MKRFVLILLSIVVLSLGVQFSTALSQSSSSFSDVSNSNPHFEAIE